MINFALIDIGRVMLARKWENLWTINYSLTKKGNYKYMKNSFLFSAIFFCVFLTVARSEIMREPIPAFPFTVESGDGAKVTEKSVKGKVVIMFYEKRDVVKRNAEMKDKLNEIFDYQPGNIQQIIVRLPVIDCSHVFWPVSEIWKKGLRDNSKRVGMTVYCDWTGNVSRDFMMLPDESNMLILDGTGMIRYRFSGKINQDRLEEIKYMLDHLVHNKN
jgi:hypothetical protein